MNAAAATLKTDASGLPWALYLCRACGLIYDESKGDEDSGLAPGTRFADIPDDWACPLCGVTKNDFEPYVAVVVEKNARRAAPGGSRRAGSRHDAGTLIVGAGRAGWQMAEALRARDGDMPITLVTSCNGDIYDKPLLSVAMTRGLAAESLPRETGSAAAVRLGIPALGDCIAIAGQVSRYIEPIGRQAQTLAAGILGHAAASFEQTPVPLRVKTSSRPFTV